VYRAILRLDLNPQEWNASFAQRFLFARDIGLIVDGSQGLAGFRHATTEFARALKRFRELCGRSAG